MRNALARKGLWSPFAAMRVVRALETALLDTELGYALWMAQTEQQKEKLRRKLKRIIQKELWPDQFWEALAHDILDTNGMPYVKSHLYRYAKRHIFTGSAKKLLQQLQRARV